MRLYTNLPDPVDYYKEFNQYLIQNNVVVSEYKYFLVIKNSFIKNQLVVFAKKNRKYLSDLSLEELSEFILIVKSYNGKEMYINADKNKSVVNRFHLHIKI